MVKFLIVYVTVNVLILS